MGRPRKSEPRWGIEANADSLPIPASIPKKFDKYIADCDEAGVEDGHVFITLKGMAFHDANTEDPSHCMARTVGEIKTALKFAEPCNCKHCRGEPLN